MFHYNMTDNANGIAFLTNNMTTYHDIHKHKMSCYDKNAVNQQARSESAGYVKVKLIADPLILN